ncbi:acyl-CoA dehydrogenase family protein [Pseudomonas umsongensis]|uniref:acyl-CoA dehydrogenase family protein n=1 Tax=Pseudomonas umsongensis TaxID=198618 RepID=UPI00200AB3E1|nr:acyl-CoA dehydrogenase family protein [Pseudomonas umsongensis]MCK8682732.1 acyl-CoA dehydrogenase family protein [Pseudomonas umsongensis]
MSSNGFLDTPELLAFRAQVEAFLAAHWKPVKGPERAANERDFRLLATEHGYLYRNVPKAYGGSEQPADILKAQIIQQVFNRARAPMEVPGVGYGMLVPTLLGCGEEWQKLQFVPPTLSGEIRWAQGYSEPNSGSDLASIRTKARLEGDEWIIDGQKIWSSGADKAHYLFMLARTEPEASKHAGISYLLVDLRQPGVTIRPLRQINGSEEFSEIFFDGARTPANWIVGQRGEGWKVSKTTLSAERAGFIGAAEGSVTLHRKLVELAERCQYNGRPAIEEPRIRDRLIVLEGMVSAHYHNMQRQFAQRLAGQDAGSVALMNKLIVTRIAAEVADIARDVLGDDFMLSPFGREAEAGPEKWLNQYLGSLGIAIAGGTSNIQRNVIAERGLGLPRDPAMAS